MSWPASPPTTDGPTATLIDDADREPVAAPAGRRRWSRKRRVLTTIGAVFTVLLLTAGGIAWWALDRFVIDHVEIGDVSAYEASVSTAPRTTAVSTTAVSTTEASATPADTTPVSTTASPVGTGTPVVTDSTYERDDLSISISTVVVGEGDDRITYYVADVVVADGTQLRSGFAQNKYGTNIISDTSDIAADYSAVFAINGDYYGFRTSGIMIRNGVVYRDDPARTGLAIYADGTMEVYDETTTSADELLAKGVWNTLSFGPALLDDGEIVDGIEDVEVDTNFGNHSIQGEQPRTGIGIVGTNHFVFVVVDGRSRGYSRGVTMTEFARIFQDLGATEAYNLDGGGSSTMYFNGSLVNDPLGKGNERGTSDILYVA